MQNEDWAGSDFVSALQDVQDGCENGREKEVVPTVSHADLAACCRVLDALSAHMQVVSSSPDLKKLRMSLKPFVDAEGGKRYGGGSKEDNALRRDAAQRMNREQQQARARDRTFIENTLLRAGRRAKLDALKEEMPHDHRLLLIPDGLGALLPLLNGEGPNIDCALLPTDDADEVLSSQRREDEHPVVAQRSEAGAQASCGRSAMPPLQNPRACYICKIRFTQLHFFYDQLCPSCAQLNYRKRMQTADLSGKVAVLTGARVKIGFRAALKLLRCGATVVATTRFPRDAAARFLNEHDSSVWSHRLHVVGLDLRDLVSLHHFTDFIQKHFDSVDIIINNACQTVRRPRAYYLPQVEKELQLLRESEDGGGGTGA